MVEWGDVFREEVLKKWLDPTDCALLARACWKCGEAVASAGLARAGDTYEVPFTLVAFFGSDELRDWAKNNGCPWVADVCALAAKLGSWRRCSGRGRSTARGTSRRVHTAARHGHLEALVWARGHGCPWDVMTCQGAARAGT